MPTSDGLAVPYLADMRQWLIVIYHGQRSDTVMLVAASIIAISWPTGGIKGCFEGCTYDQGARFQSSGAAASRGSPLLLRSSAQSS